MKSDSPSDPRDQCHLKAVMPGCELWSSYVDTCVDYIIEEWPDVLKDTSRENFRRSYEEALIQRSVYEGRYFIFFVQNGQRIGIANLYTDCLEHAAGEPKELCLTLCIDEFQVSDAWRQRGVGRTFLSKIYNFGKKLGCRSVSVEEDLGKEASNAFWRAAMRPASMNDGRKLFAGDLSKGCTKLIFLSI
jgi:GNAT superfamily N-acetyltransferase